MSPTPWLHTYQLIHINFVESNHWLLLRTNIDKYRIFVKTTNFAFSSENETVEVGDQEAEKVTNIIKKMEDLMAHEDEELELDEVARRFETVKVPFTYYASTIWGFLDPLPP